MRFIGPFIYPRRDIIVEDSLNVKAKMLLNSDFWAKYRDIPLRKGVPPEKSLGTLNGHTGLHDLDVSDGIKHGGLFAGAHRRYLLLCDAN
ncbi:MAG: hypothetical protein AB1499_04435, partial [Nitrospirota bacterium]